MCYLYFLSKIKLKQVWFFFLNWHTLKREKEMPVERLAYMHFDVLSNSKTLLWHNSGSKMSILYLK